MSNEVIKKPALITDRVKNLEELTGGLAGFVQNEVGSLKSAVSSVVEVLNAVIELSGGDEFSKKVQAHIEAKRKKRGEEQAARDQAAIAKAVADGALVVSERIGETSIIVGREYDKENNVLGNGRIQFRFHDLTEEARPDALGQGVGFVIEGPNGKLEVLEIYEVAPPKPPEVTDGKPAETTPEAPKAE